MKLEQLLKNLDAKDMATTKGREIAKALKAERYVRKDYEIELTSVEPIDGGVQVFARAWKNGKQIGFGKDGSVDIERFRFFNPPVLVDDENGDIVRTSTDEKGKVKERKLREDYEEAILQALEHTISVKQEAFDDSNIVTGKVGRTTSTFYPAAGTGGDSVDGYISSSGFSSGTSWEILYGGINIFAGPASLNSIYAVALRAGSSAWRNITRSFFTFPTSSIPDGDVISSGSISIMGNNKKEYIPDSTIKLTGASLSNHNDLTTSDWAALDTTEMSTALDFSSWSDSGRNVFSLNANGLANINKSGASEFGLRSNWDFDNSPPTWDEEGECIAGMYFADETGTTNDPFLTVEHGAPVTDTGFLMMM